MSNATAPMTSIGAVRAYIYGCKNEATFTLVSVKTNGRYTFRFRRADENRPFFFVDVLTGDDNEGDFSFIGTVRRARFGWTFKYSDASHITEDSPSVLGIDKFVAISNYSRDLNPDKIEFWHSGKCSRCGRKLTVPESLADGLGPVCRAKANAAAA